MGIAIRTDAWARLKEIKDMTRRWTAVRRCGRGAWKAGVSVAAVMAATGLARAADDADKDQTIEIPKVSVSGTQTVIPIGQPDDAEGFKDYVVKKSATGSKVETETIDVPQDIVVVPAKLIEDQNLRSVTDAMRDVAGVYSTYPGYYSLDSYATNTYIRGFQVSSTLRDGLWDPTPQGNSWMGDVERIEVLKGPSGLLNGAYSGDIGGIINVVTKKPLTDPAYTFESEFDSFGTRAIRTDLSQPLTENKDWLMRVNLEDGVYGGFAKRSDSEKRAGSIVVQGRLTDDDAITVSYERRWQEANPYAGIVGYAQKGSSDALVRIGGYSDNQNLYDPRSKWSYDSDTARAVYQHDFNPDWSIQSSNQYTVTSRDVLSISANPSVSSAGVTTYKQSYSNIRMGPVNAVDTDNLIHGKFQAFGLKNDLISGVRYADSWYDMNVGTTNNSFASYTFSDIDSPNWGQPIVGPHRRIWGYSDVSQADAYVNDVLSLTDRLKISSGVNWANYYSYSRSGMTQVPSAQGSTSYSGDGVAWRTGLIYELIHGTALFGDYSTTFKPQGTNSTDDGVIQTFDPLTGEQYEIGVKSDVTDRASVTFALYQLTLENQTQADPDPTRASLGYEVNSGKQRSRGVELDGTYNLRPGWDLLTSYAYTDAKILGSDTYVYGSAVPNVPKHSASLWSVYEVQSGDLKGFGFGGGVRGESSRTTNLITKANRDLYATMPGFATLDAVAYYRLTPNSKLTLNVNNLLNHRYYETASSYTWLYPGAPINATLRLKVTF